MILIIESTRPVSPTIGGSFRSLRVLADCLINAGEPVCVTAYFDSSLTDYLRRAGINSTVLPYYSPLHWLKSRLRIRNRTALANDFASDFGVVRVSKKNTRLYLGHIYDVLLAIINSVPLSIFIVRNRIDLVYCNTGVVSDRAGIIAALITKRKVVCHLRNLPKLRVVDRYLLGHLTGTVAISKTVSDHYERAYRSLGCSHLILHNALGEEFEQCKKSIGPNVDVNGKFFVIGCFARLIEWKGVLLLVEAFHRYCRMGGNGELRIYGDGPLRKIIVDRVRELGLSEQISIQGYVENVYQAIRCCSVVVCPSTKPEPLGRTVMESMHLGVPVIASAAGGHLETIIDRKDGILFAIGDVCALARSLKRLYDDKNYRQRLAFNALRKSERWRAKEYCEEFILYIRKTQGV